MVHDAQDTSFHVGLLVPSLYTTSLTTYIRYVPRYELAIHSSSCHVGIYLDID